MEKHQSSTFFGKLKKVLVVVLTLAMVLTSVNFGQASAATKPTLNKSKITVLIGSKTKLKVKNKVDGATYSWKSSDKTVATVTSKGVVKAKAKGTAKITCTMKTESKTYKLSCKVTVLKGASVIKIQKKSSVEKIKVGDFVNLNRKLYPKSSNDKTYWTSSDTSIASPDKKGKFTALKAGTVTITATTKSGVSDSVTIEVYGGETTVTTQEELETALAGTYTKITLATEEDVAFTIPEGNYSLTDLVVDAPNADVTNNGEFASVTIEQIKANTWYEDALNNTLTLNARHSRVVVGEGAKTTLNVTKQGATVTIVNNGTVEALNVDAKAAITIEGTSTAKIPVNCTVAGTEITSSVPLELTCTEIITLTLNAGAEGTVIHVASEDLIPTIYGTVNVTVIVGEGENASTTTVTPVAASQSSGIGSSYSGTTTVIPEPTVTPEPSATTASLSGVVTAADTATTVSGATIRVARYDGSETSLYQAVVYASTSNILAVSTTGGAYSFESLTPGKYVVLAIAQGYTANVSTIELTAGQQLVKNIELSVLTSADASLGSASGTIYEAITNQAVVVSGGAFKLTAVNTSNAAQTYSLTVTGSSYSFENIPEGTYNVTIQDLRTGIDEDSRFADSSFSIFVLGGADISSQNCYLVNSTTSGTATFVLTWGQYPRDLDSHLVGKDAAGTNHHIYYADKTAAITVTDISPVSSVSGDSYEYYASRYDLRLDVDDVTSYGPETTSIYRCNPEDAWYTFFVYNYSGNYEGTMFNSLAQVTVTTSSQTKLFSIGDTIGGTTECVWVVCKINAITGEIVAVNDIYDEYREVDDNMIEFYNFED